MERPKLCASLVSDDLAAAKAVEALVDLYEVRIDKIGSGWRALAKGLSHPWIACNRAGGSEKERIKELLSAIDLGAAIVDIELDTPGLVEVLNSIGKRARRLVSHHDFSSTPSLDELRTIVNRQLDAGADICKVVTTATRLDDNLAVLQLIGEFRKAGIVSFCMGPLGTVSRVLCPMVGGHFTYAAVAGGKESAPGQLTVAQLRTIYGLMEHA